MYSTPHAPLLTPTVHTEPWKLRVGKKIHFLKFLNFFVVGHLIDAREQSFDDLFGSDALSMFRFDMIFKMYLKLGAWLKLQ